MMRRGSSLRLVRDELNARRIREADNNWRLYVQPWGARGLHIVERECNGERIVVSGPAETFAPGSVVATGSHTGIGGEFILSPPPPGRLGGGVFPQVSPLPGVVAVAAILSADPATIEPGETNAATVLTGYGFLATDDLAAVIWSESVEEWIADPYVTLANLTFVSATELQVDVIAAASAPVGHLIRFEIVR